MIGEGIYEMARKYCEEKDAAEIRRIRETGSEEAIQRVLEARGKMADMGRTIIHAESQRRRVR